MRTKFSEDVVPLADLKTSPGRVVKHVAEAHRPVLLTSRGRGVSDIGERLLAEVFQRVETLVDHPDTGRLVPEFEQSFLRELIHRPYRIDYRHDTRHVRIVSVWRSERLLHPDPDYKTW